MRDKRYGYPQKELDYVKIICFYNKNYALLTLRIRVIDCHHFYINYSIRSRLTNTTRQACY